jgi:hypothetical protein
MHSLDHLRAALVQGTRARGQVDRSQPDVDQVRPRARYAPAGGGWNGKCDYSGYCVPVQHGDELRSHHERP